MVKMGAFLYLMRVGIQKVIGFLLYAVGTGFTMTYAGTLYFVYLFLTTLIIGWLLSNASEKTLAERGNIDTKWFFWNPQQEYKQTEIKHMDDIGG